MTKLEIIQKCLDRVKGDSTYLEIGVQNGDTFKQVKAAHKYGVDPVKLVDGVYEMTSDVFFTNYAPEFFQNRKVDVAFVDGLHTYEQSLKDVLNCLTHLADNGVIVVHDCNPPSEEIANPNVAVVPEWCGDVWKMVVHLIRYNSEELNMCVLNCDYGVGLITKVKKPRLGLDMSYKDLAANRNVLLNLRYPHYLETFLDL